MSQVKHCKDCKQELAKSQNKRNRYKLRCEPCRRQHLKNDQIAYANSSQGRELRRAADRRRYHAKYKFDSAYISKRVAQSKEWNVANRERYLEIRKRAQHTRRARKYNNGYEYIESSIVFQRDGFTCWLCNRIATQPTLDHVIPLSKGGSHTYDNVKTACLSCNIKKGAKIVEIPKQV